MNSSNLLSCSISYQEFEIAGESKTAEKLGFNTDLSKAQVITKDEDKVLDAELHTDLLNQSERDKIAEAGDYLESIYKGITDSGVGGKINTIKEQIYGDMLKKAAENYPGFVKFDEKVIDENGEILADKLNEKGNRVQDLLKYFASSVGYEGEIPRILIGDLSPGEEAFASTSNNTIAIDRNILASADSNKILSILAHELGHFNGYDSRTESTASRVENAVSGAVSKKEPTVDYEAYFKNMYEGKDISGNEAQKIIDGISEENKERYGFSTESFNIAGAFIARPNFGKSSYYIINTEKEEGYLVNTFDFGIGAGTTSVGGAISMIILPKVNSKEDLIGTSLVAGGSYRNYGAEYLTDMKGDFSGIKFILGMSKNIPDEGELHLSIDNTVFIKEEKVNINKRIIETAKELEQLSQTSGETKENLLKITGLTLKLRYEIYLENGGKERVENRKKGKYNTR